MMIKCTHECGWGNTISLSYSVRNMVHNIVRIHNNVLWDWQYYVEHSIIQAECEDYSAQ